MQFAPSICQQCSLGCNTSPGERYGELRRIENRYNGTVNHYFLCDRGRFGYGYVNLKDRPRQPVQRRGDDFITLNAEQAMQGAADILRQSKKVIGIGSRVPASKATLSCASWSGGKLIPASPVASRNVCSWY